MRLIILTLITLTATVAAQNHSRPRLKQKPLGPWDVSVAQWQFGLDDDQRMAILVQQLDAVNQWPGMYRLNDDRILLLRASLSWAVTHYHDQIAIDLMTELQKFAKARVRAGSKKYVTLKDWFPTKEERGWIRAGYPALSKDFKPPKVDPKEVQTAIKQRYERAFKSFVEARKKLITHAHQANKLGTAHKLDQPLAMIYFVPSDSFYYSKGTWEKDRQDQWALHKIGLTPETYAALFAKALSQPKPKLRLPTVAIISTGIDLAHPELTDRFWINRDEIPNNQLDDDKNGYVDDRHGFNFADNSTDLFDQSGAGTALAGIVAARWHDDGMAGVNPGAKLMVLRVVDDAGESTPKRVEDAIKYAVDNRASVILLPAPFAGVLRDKALIRLMYEANVLCITAETPGLLGDWPEGEQHSILVATGAAERADPATDGTRSVVRCPAAKVLTLQPFFGPEELAGDELPSLWKVADDESFPAAFVAGAASLLMTTQADAEHQAIRDHLLKCVDPATGMLDIRRIAPSPPVEREPEDEKTQPQRG